MANTKPTILYVLWCERIKSWITFDGLTSDFDNAYKISDEMSNGDEEEHMQYKAKALSIPGNWPISVRKFYLAEINPLR